MQKLQNHGGSGVVTLPRDDLQKDDVLVEGDIPDGQHVDVSRMGHRTYVVRIPDDGDLPELENTALVERLAAQRALNFEANRSTPQTD
jgi:hypothetical protein